MKLVICICTYNRNPSLVKCLKSINNLLVQKKVKVKIVIVDNSINYSSFKIVNKFGIGEDQLFFLTLHKYGHKIYWSKTIKVFEDSHLHRLNLKWLIRRSFRLGVLGHYIDINIHGRLTGFTINYLKCVYYFARASSYFFYFLIVCFGFKY